jgi:hypothetical protein
MERAALSSALITAVAVEIASMARDRAELDSRSIAPRD